MYLILIALQRGTDQGLFVDSQARIINHFEPERPGKS